MSDEGLLAENYATLNKHFYGTQPWIYFQQRLSHLMLVTSDRDRYRTIFDEGVQLGAIQLKVEVDPDSKELPTPEQSYTAIEAETLLHHSAETLLRFVYAHAEPDPCPWLRMSRLTDAARFKKWVRENVFDVPREQLADLCQRIFAVDPQKRDELDSHVEYLRLLAEHFLAADSYNAAKHGMVMRGGSERRQIIGEKWKLFDRDGATLTWLARWPRGKAGRSPRWTLVSRIFSVEATVALTYVTTMLMRGIWIRGSELHLGEEWDELFRPASPEDLFTSFDLRHHVLADWYEPLLYGARSAP
ncbi:MAG: hypothetical protein ACRDK4_06605 [Solirubrobacteraceae bacterium]